MLLWTSSSALLKAILKPGLCTHCLVDDLPMTQVTLLKCMFIDHFLISCPLFCITSNTRIWCGKTQGFNFHLDSGRSFWFECVVFFFLLFVCFSFFLRQISFVHQPWISWNWLNRPGWAQTHTDSPASTSQMWNSEVWGAISRNLKGEDTPLNWVSRIRCSSVSCRIISERNMYAPPGRTPGRKTLAHNDHQRIPHTSCRAPRSQREYSNQKFFGPIENSSEQQHQSLWWNMKNTDLLWQQMKFWFPSPHSGWRKNHLHLVRENCHVRLLLGLIPSFLSGDHGPWAALHKWTETRSKK